MIKLIGEFLSTEQNTNKQTGELRSYVNVLETDKSRVIKVRVQDLQPYLKIERGTPIELPLKLTTYNNNIFYNHEV